MASAAHANKMALYLQNKQKHHEKTAATLERKAQKLMEKAKLHSEKLRDLKKAKLVSIDDDDNNNNNKTDEEIWSQVPTHVKVRIVGRWHPSLVEQVDELATFLALPGHCQNRVRHRVLKHGVQPHPPTTTSTTEMKFANPAFQNAPQAEALPLPELVAFAKKNE